MKQILALICLAIIVSQGAVYSAAIEKVTEERGYISSSAEKDKDVYPNVAEISFTKETTEKTIELASTKNKEVMAYTIIVAQSKIPQATPILTAFLFI